MNIKVVGVIVIVALVAIVAGYVYAERNYYGADDYDGVPVEYVPINETDGTLYGITYHEADEDGVYHPVKVVVYVTGDPVEDAATYYHEGYHVAHPEEGDNDVAAEDWAAENVPGYIPKELC
jgi:hypothetical protein